MPFDEKILHEISRRVRNREHPLVTIDGRCASGKTTLSAQLAEILPAAVVHTDDYVIPHARKTPDRLAVPGGNCDADRLFREIVIPWKNHLPVHMRRYDCRADLLLPEEVLPAGEILILEGCYCNLPPVRAAADVRVFLDVSREVQETRLRERESPESLKRFYSLWIPLEETYFAAYGLPDPDCMMIKA